MLERLGIPLKAVWLPSGSAKEHARINIEEGLIYIYGEDRSEAWNSPFHEVLEYRLRSLLNPYRRLVNKLVEFVEAEAYA